MIKYIVTLGAGVLCLATSSAAMALSWNQVGGACDPECTGLYPSNWALVAGYQAGVGVAALDDNEAPDTPQFMQWTGSTWSNNSGSNTSWQVAYTDLAGNTWAIEGNDSCPGGSGYAYYLARERYYSTWMQLDDTTCITAIAATTTPYLSSYPMIYAVPASDPTEIFQWDTSDSSWQYSGYNDTAGYNIQGIAVFSQTTSCDGATYPEVWWNDEAHYLFQGTTNTYYSDYCVVESERMDNNSSVVSPDCSAWVWGVTADWILCGELFRYQGEVDGPYNGSSFPTGTGLVDCASIGGYGPSVISYSPGLSDWGVFCYADEGYIYSTYDF
jgi:hypothetical protein